MDETEELRAARAMRRAMLGDAYVDRVTADPDPVAAEFQDYLTSMAWGVWTRGGALTTRDRSLLVMAMTAALGRMEEFRLHAGSTAQTGVTDAEIDELLFQIAAYCGAPAGVSARREIQAMRAERDGAADGGDRRFRRAREHGQRPRREPGADRPRGRHPRCARPGARARGFHPRVSCRRGRSARRSRRAAAFPTVRRHNRWRTSCSPCPIAAPPTWSTPRPSE